MKSSKLVGFVGSLATGVNKHKKGILLGVTIAGSVSATISAWVNAPKARDILDEHRRRMEEIPPEDKVARRRETIDTVKELAPLVAPPVVLTALSVGGAVGGHSVSTKQIAALSAAYSFSEKKLSDVMEKSIEKFGEKKTEALVDAVNQDTVAKNPPPSHETIISTGKGQTLCYDDFSGRYFYSDAESIRRAVNEINRRLIDEMYVSLNDFYYELGLSSVGAGNDFGFCVDDMLDTSFTTTLTPDDRPCLVLNYRISPRYGYGDMGGSRFYR